MRARLDSSLVFTGFENAPYSDENPHLFASANLRPYPRHWAMCGRILSNFTSSLSFAYKSQGFHSLRRYPHRTASVLSSTIINLRAMFSSRVISLFFLLVTFGLFACAKPIVADATDLVARSDLTVRGGGGGGGHSGQDIIDILLDLKVKIDLNVAILGKLGVLYIFYYNCLTFTSCQLVEPLPRTSQSTRLSSLFKQLSLFLAVLCSQSQLRLRNSLPSLTSSSTLFLSVFLLYLPYDKAVC